MLESEDVKLILQVVLSTDYILTEISTEVNYVLPSLHQYEEPNIA